MNTAQHAALSPTLAAATLDRLGLSRDRALNAPILAVLGSLFIALCAQIAVPMWPVPATMQTFAVLLVGAALGARLGAAAVLLYLVEGAMGMPFFSNGAFGAARFLGPTGGYLLAFPVAAFLVGYLAQLGLTRTFARAACSMFAGTLLILAVGAVWLSIFFPHTDAFTAGFAIFLPGGVLKTLLAAALLPAAWKFVRR
ncbi:MAG: biotin transporter BioY [Phycisphaerales bacterium]